MFKLFFKNIKHFNDQLFIRSFDISKVSKSSEPAISDIIEISNILGISLDDLMRKDFSSLEKVKLKSIKFLVVDVDGVLTDAGMYYSESGDFWKKFNAKDGRGIIELAKQDFPVGIISTSSNKNLIGKRATTMRVSKFYAGEKEKLEVLSEWCSEMRISIEAVAFIGDDLNDLKVMNEVGFVACPIDATSEVKSIAHLVLQKKGGEGCVREFIDDYLRPAIGLDLP